MESILSCENKKNPKIKNQLKRTFQTITVILYFYYLCYYYLCFTSSSSLFIHISHRSPAASIVDEPHLWWRLRLLRQHRQHLGEHHRLHGQPGEQVASAQLRWRQRHLCWFVCQVQHFSTGILLVSFTAITMNSSA